jgi:stearoyl-CoA desaturase (delta-9 desaturase)
VDGRLFSSNVIVITALHLAALLALDPYLFTWTGVALVFVGNFVFGSLGINIGYHRLLTHRGFKCPKWLERTFALLGVCCLQDSPTQWVAIHRMHHRHSDEQPDPHSPLVSLPWGWVGWLTFRNRHLRRRGTLRRYAPDLCADPFYARLHRNRLWFYVYMAHAALFLAAGTFAGWLWTGTREGAVRFGLSVFVWGVIVRTVYVWHVTWSVNALAHRWGYRNYETGENSRNNWFVSLLTNGEGWHNNHHAAPRSARHGHRWWELDPTYAVIALLLAVGLVTDVSPPRVPRRLAPEFDPSTRRPSRAHGEVPPAPMSGRDGDRPTSLEPPAGATERGQRPAGRADLP